MERASMSAEINLSMATLSCTEEWKSVQEKSIIKKYITDVFQKTYWRQVETLCKWLMDLLMNCLFVCGFGPRSADKHGGAQIKCKNDLKKREKKKTLMWQKKTNDSRRHREEPACAIKKNVRLQVMWELED